MKGSAVRTMQSTASDGAAGTAPTTHYSFHTWWMRCSWKHLSLSLLFRARLRTSRREGLNLINRKSLLDDLEKLVTKLEKDLRDRCEENGIRGQVAGALVFTQAGRVICSFRARSRRR